MAASNPLRQAAQAKYGGAVTDPSGAGNAPVITPVRQKVIQQYGPAQTPAPQITNDGTALVPTKAPAPAPAAKPVSLRDQLAQKYVTATPDSAVGKEQAQQAADNTKKYGAIASPEYFANSVDVRAPGGKFVGTYTGSNPGEAEQKARDAAAKIGGTIEVTPPGGFFGKAWQRVSETFKGALDNFAKVGNETFNTLGAVKPGEPGTVAGNLGQLVPDASSTPVTRAASLVNFGVAGINAVLAPLSAAFTGAEEVPGVGPAAQGVNYIFGKLGEGGGWVADKAVDALPVSDTTKEAIRPAAEQLSGLLAQLAAGKLGAHATGVALDKTTELRSNIKTAITKDVIEQNQLPRTVFISPEAVKSIFQTGDKISPEELDMIKALGLSSREYRTAIQNGVTISVPSEKLITIVDKPWFAKVKGIFNIVPDSTTKVIKGGDVAVGAEQRPSRLLPGPSDTSVTPVPVQPVKTTVTEALTAPVTPKLLEKINSLTPTEQSAFGRKLTESINEAIGGNIAAGKMNLPDNVDVIEQPSGDGRPAQYSNGKIQIFLPNLLQDIRDLAAGKTITAHEGEFSTVYKKQPNESMEELATRYVRDIILHEASHQKTFTLEDASKIRALQNDINVAKLANKESDIIAARKALTEYMRTVEDKANAYMRDNRAALEKEFLGGPKKITQTELQRQIARNTRGGIPRNTPSMLTEKQALKQRLSARARGAREGFSAGKKEGAIQAKEETSSRYEAAIKKIKDRQASIESKQKDLIDYAQLLPFRERGKFLKAINNTKTDKEFGNVLERMRKASNLAERKVLISKITDELKGTAVKRKDGLPKAKFEYRAQKTLDSMRALQRSMTYQEAQIQIAEKIAAWQTANPDAAFPADMLREIEILKTVGIKEQTVSELSDTLAAIQSVKDTGRTLKELERFNFDTEMQQVKDKVFDTITGGKKLPSEKLSIKSRDPKPTTMRSVKNFLTTQQYGLEEVLDVLSENDMTSKPYQSFLSRYVGDRVSDAFNTQNKGEMDQIAKVNESLKSIYGIEKNTAILQLLGSMKERVSLGDFKHTDGVTRTLELSKGEAMQYYMWMQDPTLEQTFAETLHWGDEIKNAVVESLTPTDRKMADSLLDFYRTYYKSVNAEFSKEFGVDLPFNENYSPVHRAVDVTIPENVLLAQEAAKYASAKNGSLKSRVKSTIDLKPTDAFENVTRHIAKMEHYKAWADPMRRFRRIFSDTQVRTAIHDFHGDYLTVMDNFLNDFARDGVAREKVVQAIDTLRGNVTKAMLGLNVKVGIKQLTGVLNYGIEMPVKDFFMGMVDFWKDPIGKARFLHDESLTLQERFGEGFERDIKYAIQRGYDKKLARANNLSEVMFIPIRNADRLTVYLGSWAAYRSGYNEALAHGLSEEAAVKEGIRNAENVTNRTQESSRMDTLSPLQRGGSWAKLFTMFQSQPSKYIRVMMNAGRNYKAGRQDAKTAMRRIAWAWLIAPFFYNLLADQFIDKKYRESSGGLVTRTLLGPLTYPLIIGQMFQQLYGWTQGERFTYQASPVESFMNDLQSAVQNFSTGDAIDGTTYAIDVAGKLVGVPTTILTKPVRNAKKSGSSTQNATVSF